MEKEKKKRFLFCILIVTVLLLLTLGLYRISKKKKTEAAINESLSICKSIVDGEIEDACLLVERIPIDTYELGLPLFKEACCEAVLYQIDYEKALSFTLGDTEKSKSELEKFQAYINLINLLDTDKTDIELQEVLQLLEHTQDFYKRFYAIGTTLDDDFTEKVGYFLKKAQDVANSIEVCGPDYVSLVEPQVNFLVSDYNEWQPIDNNDNSFETAARVQHLIGELINTIVDYYNAAVRLDINGLKVAIENYDTVTANLKAEIKNITEVLTKQMNEATEILTKVEDTMKKHPKDNYLNMLNSIYESNL